MKTPLTTRVQILLLDDATPADWIRFTCGQSIKTLKGTNHVHVRRRYEQFAPSCQ